MAIRSRNSRPTLIAGAFALITACSAIAPAFAAPATRAQVISACTPDAMRLCFTSLGNESSMLACMSQNQNKLSRPCKDTLAAK